MNYKFLFILIFPIIIFANDSFGTIYLSNAKEFIGTEYKASTLEVNSVEQCVLNLEGMDCVTFFENSLAFARANQNKNNFDTLLIKDELIKTRYRNNKIDGYLSRLHYSSEWILENTKSGEIVDITKDLGGLEYKPNLFFMSKNHHLYKNLNDSLKIREIEQTIIKNTLYYIPKNSVAQIEDKLISGDIIFIRTSLKGLDYSHVGIIDKSDGKSRLLHASSKNKKVMVDTTISEYLKPHKSQIGITVLRPIK